MNDNKRWLLPCIFFAAATLLNLAGRLWLPAMAAAVKPALLPLLAVTCAVYAQGRGLRAKDLNLLVMAQLLGCAGDIFLLHSEVFLLFAGGIVSFLAGHVAYLKIFGSRAWKGMSGGWWAVSCLAVGALVAILIRVIGVSGALLAPMAIYGAVLILVPFTGLCGILRLGGCNWWIVFTGGLLFLVSDAMIAVQTFNELSQPELVGFLIMLTYLAAQSLLAVGALRLARQES